MTLPPTPVPSPRWGRGVLCGFFPHKMALGLWAALLVLAVLCLPLPGFGFDALAHGMAGKDAEFVKHSVGAQILPFFYLGAKHMATGYDHLLFAIGTVFFLYRLRHVAIYVTTFSIGHS